MVDRLKKPRERGEVSCPEDGPHQWLYDLTIQHSVCVRCGILSDWVEKKRIRDRYDANARRLLNE